MSVKSIEPRSRIYINSAKKILSDYIKYGQYEPAAGQFADGRCPTFFSKKLLLQQSTSN